MKKISVLKKEWLHREIEKLARNNVTKADIARILEVKPQYLNSVLNSDRGVTDQFIDKFIEKFNITHIDLFSDTIVPIPKDSSSTIEERLLAIIKEKDTHIEEQARLIGRMQERLDNSQSHFRPDGDLLSHDESDSDPADLSSLQGLPKSTKSSRPLLGLGEKK